MEQDLYVACECGHGDLVNALLEKGIDPNALRIGDGAPPLLGAALSGSLFVVMLEQAAEPHCHLAARRWSCC